MVKRVASFEPRVKHGVFLIQKTTVFRLKNCGFCLIRRSFWVAAACRKNWVYFFEFFMRAAAFHETKMYKMQIQICRR